MAQQYMDRVSRWVLHGKQKGLIWYRVWSTKMSATNLWYNRRLRMCGSKISEIVLRKVCMVIRIATDTTPQQWKMATEVYLQMHSHHGTCVLTCGDEITYSFMLLISRHHWSLSVVKPQTIWLVCARCYWCGALMISIFIVFYIKASISRKYSETANIESMFGMPAIKQNKMIPKCTIMRFHLLTVEHNLNFSTVRNVFYIIDM